MSNRVNIATKTCHSTSVYRYQMTETFGEHIQKTFKLSNYITYLSTNLNNHPFWVKKPTSLNIDLAESC